MIESIISEIEARYGCRLVRLTGGYTNLAFRMEGTDPPLAVKIASLSSEDAVNEANSLRLVQGRCPAPVIHNVWETADARIVVMDAMRGVNGQTVLDAGDWERAERLYRKLGRLLAEQIHTVRWEGILQGVRTSSAAPGLNGEALAALDFVPPHLAEQSRELLSHWPSIADERQWTLTHGDYGLHNVLCDEADNLAVLDWEWAEWGSPLNDVAWVCWFTRLHYSEHAPMLNRAFVDGYLSNSSMELPSEQLRASCVYKVWNVLQRVRSAPQEVQNEWVRRLRWTLALDFGECCR